MKSIFGSVFLLLALLFTPLWGQERDQKIPSRLKRAVDRISKALDLTGEQKQKLRAIVKSHQGDIWELYLQHKQGRISKKNLKKEMRKIHRKIIGQTQKFLTSEQKEKFRKLRQRGRKGRKGKKGRRTPKVNPDEITEKLNFKDDQKSKEFAARLEQHLALRQGHNQTLREMRQTLQEILKDSQAPEAMIKKVLESYRESKKRAEKELAQSKEKLTRGLSPRQKALLIAYGII